CDALGYSCLPISGATNQTYVPVAADVGHTIRVQETASNAGGSGSPATSAATAAVTPPAPTNTAPPTISGTAQQGQTLTESHVTWTNEPTSYSYHCQRCSSDGNSCMPISGATSQAYVLVAADVEHTIRVQETASNAGGPGAPATSAATAVVTPPGPVNSAPPTISGSAQQGQTLTESHGTWTNQPTSYSYQWQRCNSEGNSCAASAGATTQTYVSVAADVGHTIRVQETASNAGGPRPPAPTPPSADLTPPGPVNSAPPTISGTPQQGQTLTEIHGAWTNGPTSYSYQWQRCNSEGNSCAA